AAGGKRLDSVDLLPGQHGQEQQTTVDGHVAAFLAENDGAGAALALGAPLLRPGETLRTDEIQQSGLGWKSRGVNRAAVQKEFEIHERVPIVSEIVLHSAIGTGRVTPGAALSSDRVSRPFAPAGRRH